jgi:hypothetical protein
MAVALAQMIRSGALATMRDPNGMGRPWGIECFSGAVGAAKTPRNTCRSKLTIKSGSRADGGAAAGPKALLRGKIAKEERCLVFISDSPLAGELIGTGDEAIACENDAALRAYFSADYVFHGPGGDMGFEDSAPTSPRCGPRSAICESSVSTSSWTATSWRRAPRSPETSSGSLPTRPSVQSSPLGITSSGKRSVPSGTTTRAGWPRNGFRPTTAAL